MGKRRGELAGANVRFAALTLAAASLLLDLTGCQDVRGAPPCMPPAYSVSPASAKPGDKVTVSAPDASCDARYGAGAQVQVTVRDETGTVVLDELAPMTDDGGFSFVFTVPEPMVRGTAVVSAYPFGLDWCDDTGVNNRAAAAGPALVRISCAERAVPLIILGPG